MRKSNDIVWSKLTQNLTSGLVQNLSAAVMLRIKPLSLEHPPYGLGNVEVWTARREKEYIESSLFPLVNLFRNLPFTMNGGIVKDYERRTGNFFGEIIKIIGKPCSVDAFCGVEAPILTRRRYHAKNIETLLLLNRYIDILFGELPSIRHISACAYMALVSEPKFYKPHFPKIYKFLQLEYFKIDQLRRGFPLRTFPYTSISRAKADKKALKVLSEASFPEACCHASFAFFTLCLSFSMALRTASSSEQSIIGFRPRPGPVSNPLIPSASKRFTQELTDIWVMSVCSPICFEVRPVDFRSTARQRMRKAWLLPLRKPSSSCRRCWSVSCITLIFAIVVCLYVFTQRYVKISI